MKSQTNYYKGINTEGMSKEEKKRYKKLVSLNKFLTKKINKMQKTVDLYEKTLQIRDIHLYNALLQIERKYYV